MDPISIATAVATATTALYTVTNMLSSFVNDAKNVNNTLEVIRGDVESLVKILVTIKSVLTAPTTQPALAAVVGSNSLWDAILASVKDCSDTAVSIKDILGKIMTGAALQTFVAKSIRQVRFLKKKQDIDRIQVRVNAHKTNLQLSLQTMNILVAQCSSNHLTESIAPKVDDLWKMLSKTSLAGSLKDGSGVRYSEDVDNADLSRHTLELRASSTDFLSGVVSDNTLPAYEEARTHASESDTDPEWSEVDSDEELEVNISISLMAKGMELCDDQRFTEAEATLQNSLQAIQRIITPAVSVEYIKKAQLKLAVTYLYQEKWDQAEEILLYLTTDTASSDAEVICRLDALYYMAQIRLARHQFDMALESCKDVRSGRKKVLGKQHPSYYQSVVLLVLIYETSNDRSAAAAYAKTVPSECLSDKAAIAVLRFSSEGSALSIDRELAAKKILTVMPYGLNYPNRETDLALRWAAGAGHQDLVQLLLWRGVNPNAPSIDSVTPLMCAATGGHEGVATVLLDKGADINSKANGGDSALARAARNGHESLVRMLLDRGVEIDGNSANGWSTMTGAASEGHDRILQLLIERGAGVNVMNLSYKRTALMYAAREGRNSTVALLLRAGAEVNARDENGHTAMNFAHGKADVLQTLREAGGTDEKAPVEHERGSS